MLCFWNPNQPILEGSNSQALGRLCKEIRTVVLVRVVKGSSGILAPTMVKTRGRTREQAWHILYLQPVSFQGLPELELGKLLGQLYTRES